MDVVCSLATTQATQDQRLARAEATLGHCHSMLQQIMTHLGIPHGPDQRDEPTAAAASLDMLATAAAATTHHHHRSEVVRFLFMILYSFQHYQLPTNFM